MIRCFYHSADLDGHCSGAIVKYRFPEAMMYPINYGDEFPWGEIAEDDKVYMVDFALQPIDELIRLAMVCNLIWIDHHKSAIKDFEEYFERGSLQDFERQFKGMRHTGKAACELTWEYLFPDRPVPLAVKLLSLYDSWTYQGHELEDMVLPFQMRLRMEELDPIIGQDAMGKWGILFDPEGEFLTGRDVHFPPMYVLTQEGELLLRYDEANKAKYARTYSFETSMPPCPGVLDEAQFGDSKIFSSTPFYKAIAVNLGHTNSKVFDAVWRRECPACDGKGSVPRMGYGGGMSSTDIRRVWEPCIDCSGKGYIEPYDLMISFVRRSDKLWNVSLYSTKPDVDCGAIAKSFGGGGHLGAAGFQYTELPFEY